MDITTVGVVGAGLMGSGIAQVCAGAGLRVRVCEADPAALEAGKSRIDKSLARGVELGKVSADDAASTKSRLTWGTTLDAFSDCDFVIEAIVEKIESKTNVFAQLDSITPAHAILATNTSSLPIIDIARATKRPDRVIGMHFFNPVPIMNLVEIVRSIATSKATFDATKELSTRLRKEVVVAQDRGGFIVNLLLMPYLCSAVKMYESGFASKEDIDTGMRLGCGHPMGPLQLLDHIGLDTAVFICDALYTEYGTPEFVAPQLLRRMVAAGQMGRKSGHGFYDY